MATRSYHQYCSLARALDLVGERWTLLIVRDLLDGPRRYGELLEGLPGIGTNLLAARLKQLTRLGITERRPAPQGRGGTYALTAAGRELETALIALARFGTRAMAEREPDDLWRPGWTTLALKATFRAEAAQDVRACYEFRVDGEVFHARVSHGRVETARGAADAPHLVLTASSEDFLALAGGQVTPRDAFASERFEIQGDLATLETCTEIFRLPPA